MTVLNVRKTSIMGLGFRVAVSSGLFIVLKFFFGPADLLGLLRPLLLMVNLKAPPSILKLHKPITK